MTKHLHLKKVLAKLLTIAALAAGQQAFATINGPVAFTGYSATYPNNSTYSEFKIAGLNGISQITIPGSSFTFSGQQFNCDYYSVGITGTLNFTTGTNYTDIYTGSQVTIVITSGTNYWFYDATVKKLDGTNVTGCSASASSDHTSITITIPSGKTFGNIYLDFVAYEPFYNYNTTISGVESTYIYTGRPIEPVPTVIYNGTVLTAGTDYTVSYSNSTGPGSASVTVTGTGQYAGTVTRNYNIRAVALTDFNSLGSNTYAIATTTDLDHLAGYVNLGNECQGLTFKQTADITYSHGSSTTENNFTQIGGYFDGQGHTISGIRLYKTGNSNPSKNQGLFGRINGATIKNVILTDARITGYRYVGGIVGNKASGTVQNCLVLESTITCENTYVGALFGGNSGTITANHYHGCTVNGTANATNVGVGGNGGTSSSSDKNGARSAHILTLGENVTATGESVTYQGTTYYASTTTVTLGYDNLPAGYTVTYTLNGTALTGNTFTMPANDNATVDASTALITYNITYDLDGGSVATANPTTYNFTTPTFTLNNPTKAGYTFTGWTGSNGTTPQTTVTIAQGSTGDLNYTAQWSLNTYNITYDLGGGSVATANPTTYNVQTPTFTLTNPTRAACNFDGWTGTDLTEPTMTVTIAQGSTGDRSYTAHWTQYAFTLTLGTNITASGTVAFTLDGTDYYAPGTEITLAYSGTIPEGYRPLYSVNSNAIVGNTFEMPTADVVVDAVLLERYYTFSSTTGELALLWGEFNKNNKWGSEVTSSAVTRVTATDEVSFTGDCYELFYNFTSCTSMDLNNVNTDNLTNIRCMFWGCQSLTTLNLSGWNTANVTNMIYMFLDCSSLQSLDLSGWNTANVTNMSGMFEGCSGLQSLNVSGWNTDNVTNMIYMFLDCSSLQSLNISSWNTANVTNMIYMFLDCSSLQSLDLSGWNTANVTDMSYMFRGCSGLQSLNVSGWNTANVTDMSGMFDGCSGLQSLDLSGWSTANVSDMSGMFYSCSGLQSLDLSGWSTANVSDMSHMFQNCTNLATIYVGEGWSTSWVNRSNYMFSGCTSLVGGMGTHYISIHNDKAYARIDGGPHNPGYFTAPFTKEIAGYGNDENPGGYYLIASPVGTVNPENVGNMTANAFDLYRFNQSADLEWENWKAEGNNYHFDLEVGKGYLYANSEDVTLTFTGTLVEGDTYEVTLAKDNGATFAGWNLVGNPFTKTAYIQGNHSFYTMNADGSNLVASTSTSIEAMEGVFVIANTDGETLTFTTNAPNQGKKQIVLNVTQGRGNVIDRAIVRFGQSDLLPKFTLNPSDSKVYIPMDGNNFAVMRSSNSGRLPVCFEPSEDGTYFINVDIENVAVRYLHLIDHEMGTDIDLLREPSYKFDAKAEGKPNRFELVVKTNFKQYKEVFSRGGDSDGFAFISNGEILIDGEGTLQVIDATGRGIHSGDAINRVSTSGMTPGVYVLRLIDGDTIRTQKIVID